MLAAFLPGPRAPIVLVGLTVLLPLGTGAFAAARTAVGLSIPFWFFLVVIHGVIGGDPMKAVVIASRLSSIIIACTTVISVVHPARVTEALVQAGAPFSVAYVFSATLQAVPRLKERAKAILETQQCRGLSLRGPVLARIRNLVPLAVPLVLTALAEIDERAVALETRGAALGVRRTALDPPRWRAADRLVAGASVITGLGALLWWWVR